MSHLFFVLYFQFPIELVLWVVYTIPDTTLVRFMKLQRKKIPHIELSKGRQSLQKSTLIKPEQDSWLVVYSRDKEMVKV